MGFFVEPLGHVITLRGQILVSRTVDDPLSLPPCVYIQNVPVCTGTTPTCVYTCGRVAGTHGHVLDVHTRERGKEVTPHTTPHHTTPHTTPHNHTMTTPHNDNDDDDQPAASFDSTREKPTRPRHSKD